MNSILETAVIYCRVSTVEQGVKGLSLSSQLTVIKKFCEQRKIRVVKDFSDTATGTKFDRDGFNALREFCKKKPPHYVLIWRWDRLGRDAIEMLSTVRAFRKLGVEINATEQWKDNNSADSNFMLGLQAILAERESAVTSERTRMNMISQNEKGYFLNKPPIGYKRSNTLDEKGKRPIVVCETGAGIVNDIFKMFVGGMSKMDIRREVLKKYPTEIKEVNRKFPPMAIRRILENRLYIGELEFSDIKGEKKIVKSVHPKIIALSVFQQAQDLLRQLDTKHGKAPHAEKIEYPLKDSIFCPVCHTPLRAYKVKKILKRTKRIQETHYYDCQKNHFRINIKEAHRLMLEALTELQPSEDVTDTIIKKRIESILSDRQKQIEKIRQDYDEAKTKLKKLDDMLLGGTLTAQSYERIAKQLVQDIEEKEIELSKNVDSSKQQSTILSKTFEFALRISKTYQKTGGAAQKRIVKAVFPYGFYIDKKNDTILTYFINNILVAISLQSIDYKKIHLIESSGLSFCTPNGRIIEPKQDIKQEIELLLQCFC